MLYHINYTKRYLAIMLFIIAAIPCIVAQRFESQCKTEMESLVSARYPDNKILYYEVGSKNFLCLAIIEDNDVYKVFSAAYLDNKLSDIKEYDIKQREDSVLNAAFNRLPKELENISVSESTQYDLIYYLLCLPGNTGCISCFDKINDPIFVAKINELRSHLSEYLRIDMLLK